MAINTEGQHGETEDEHFARTGRYSEKLKIKINITQHDMLHDLVNRSEGSMINAEDLKDHNKN